MNYGSMEFSRQMLHALNLSDAQKEQVREAFATYRTTVQPLREDMRTTRQQCVDLLLPPNPLDAAALQTLQQHLALLQTDLLQARVTLAQAIRSHLTMEQLVQATQITGQMRDLKAHMRQLFTPSQP
jgi:Spy/CpxP family protein refolding chaperone